MATDKTRTRTKTKIIDTKFGGMVYLDEKKRMSLKVIVSDKYELLCLYEIHHKVNREERRAAVRLAQDIFEMFAKVLHDRGEISYE